MLIKGYLIKSHSSAELKKVGHNLAKLWSMFKSAEGETKFAHFDRAIRELDKVETLRYPDAMVDEGFVLNVRLGVLTPVQLPGLGNQPQYFVNVSDLDDIALAIFVSCRVNPRLGFKNTPTELLASLPPALRPIE
jgi:hypothetical protein